MIEYDKLDKNLKEWLEDIASEDEYGLSPKTLYSNILHSTGEAKTLASIFVVPIGLVLAIKDNQNQV